MSEDTEDATLSRAQRMFGTLAPKLASLTDEVLFGDVWERPGLSPRDRSLITVAALVALCRENQMPGHFSRALDNGVQQDELVEIITHLAFYAGWPNAVTAIATLATVLEQENDAAIPTR
ncbi:MULTISPECIES: carboxymuconolactone decarboxylase family protein [Actinomycetes]|uniref:carboxymuconolactone decarboxylase family protein n=1 Tax=Actinomycetes TaxID=1760 RepID=UPI003664A1CE